MLLTACFGLLPSAQAQTLTTLHTFTNGADGANPRATLVQGNDGNYYGTTSGDNNNSLGTVFRITPSGTLTTLHTITSGANGGTPYAGLVQGSDGSFYGTTYASNDSNGIGDGTVFRITPGGTLTTLYAFTSGPDGSTPKAALVQGSDGNFYGTTGESYGGNSFGTVFRITPGGSSSGTGGGTSGGASGSLQTFDANYQYTHVDLSDTHIADAASLYSLYLNALETEPHSCAGAVADGATKVVLRYDAPGTVTFTEPIGVTGDKLRMVNSAAAPVNVQTQLIDGTNSAFAIYTVPEAIDNGQAQQAVTFQASFTPADNTPGQSSASTLMLYRTPVMLVHGLASSESTWLGGTGPYNSLLSSGFDVHLIDYQSTNNSSFATNQFVLWSDHGGEGIGSIRHGYRARHIAITKVDVVGHSMGGLLAREYAAFPGYKQEANFYSGDIRRLVTLGTPHNGSPLIAAVNSLHGGSGGAFVDSFMAYIHNPYGPAFVDMQPGSSALRALGATPIPSYAEVGNYSAQSFGDLTNFYNLLLFFGLNLHYRGLPSASNLDSYLFKGEDNDVAVPVSSQEGGLASSYYTIYGFTNHLQETSSDAMGASVAGLLAGPLSSFSINGFAPSTAAAAMPLIPTRSARLRASATTASFAAVTAPTEGQVFLPGQTLTVTVTPNTGTTLTQVFISAGGSQSVIGTAFVNQAPYTATFTIPASYVGSLPITVLAQDDSGNICQASVNASV